MQDRRWPLQTPVSSSPRNLKPQAPGHGLETHQEGTGQDQELVVGESRAGLLVDKEEQLALGSGPRSGRLRPETMGREGKEERKRPTRESSDYHQFATFVSVRAFGS